MTHFFSRGIVATFGLVLLAGAVGVAGVEVAQGANGTVNASANTHNYPPKTKLHLVANRASVAVSQKVTLTAFHAGPGCRVKFTFGSQHAYRATSGGQAAATFTSTATSGVIHASATTYDCAYKETAFTSVRASSPAIKLPSHVTKNQPFHVTIYQFPGHSFIRVRVYNSTFAKTLIVKTGSGGSASPTFTVPKAGSYVVLASGQGAFASTVLHANNH